MYGRQYDILGVLIFVISCDIRFGYTFIVLMVKTFITRFYQNFAGKFVLLIIDCLCVVD